jgi:hypothetical protein
MQLFPTYAQQCAAPFCPVVTVHLGQVARLRQPAAAATAGPPSEGTLQEMLRTRGLVR